MNLSRKGRASAATMGALCAGVLTLALGVGDAFAELIVPHASQNTPHVVTPTVAAPAPAPPPPPSSTAVPQAAQSEGNSQTFGGSDDEPIDPSQLPGANIPGSPSDPPFPDGLSNHWDSGCDLDCRAEWLTWYQARAIAVSVEAMATGNVEQIQEARMLADEVKQIEQEIEASGGTVTDEDMPDAGVEQMPSADAPAGFGDSSSQTTSVSSWGSPDAISGASAIIPENLPALDAVAKAIAPLATTAASLSGLASVLGPVLGIPVGAINDKKCPHATVTTENRKIEDTKVATSACH